MHRIYSLRIDGALTLDQLKQTLCDVAADLLAGREAQINTADSTLHVRPANRELAMIHIRNGVVDEVVSTIPMNAYQLHHDKEHGDIRAFRQIERPDGTREVAHLSKLRVAADGERASADLRAPGLQRSAAA